MQVAALSPATSHPPRGIFSSTIVPLKSATCLFSLLVSLRRKNWPKMGTRWQFRSLASMLMLDGFGGSSKPSEWEMGTANPFNEFAS